jgi:hypothetical protein
MSWMDYVEDSPARRAAMKDLHIRTLTSSIEQKEKELQRLRSELKQAGGPSVPEHEETESTRSSTLIDQMILKYKYIDDETEKKTIFQNLDTDLDLIKDYVQNKTTPYYQGGKLKFEYEFLQSRLAAVRAHLFHPDEESYDKQYNFGRMNNNILKDWILFTLKTLNAHYPGAQLNHTNKSLFKITISQAAIWNTINRLADTISVLHDQRSR